MVYSHVGPQVYISAKPDHFCNYITKALLMQGLQTVHYLLFVLPALCLYPLVVIYPKTFQNTTCQIGTYSLAH